MLKLKYQLEKYPDYQYDILQLREGETYQFFHKNTLIGGINKIGDKWEQTSGRETSESIVNSMGKFIEQNS